MTGVESIIMEVAHSYYYKLLHAYKAELDPPEALWKLWLPIMHGIACLQMILYSPDIILIK